MTDLCSLHNSKLMYEQSMHWITNASGPTQLLQRQHTIPFKSTCESYRPTPPLNILDAILGATAAPSRQTATSLEEEIDSYLQLDPIPRTESTTAWWSNSATRFPLLAVEAKRYLSAPPSSVASERLFSLSAQVYTDRRNRMLPKHADMLLFVKHNLPLVHFQYWT